jgi:hypothetical protein
MPSNTGPNTWNICFTIRVNGELKIVSEEFFGSIREAMFYEMQLRGLVKDGNLS